MELNSRSGGSELLAPTQPLTGVENNPFEVQPTSRGMVMLPGGEFVGKIVDGFGAVNIEASKYEALQEVFEGRAAGVRFTGVIDKETCEKITDNFVDHPEVHREDVTPPILTIGKHLYACGAGETVSCYFNELGKTNRIVDEILGYQKDPLISYLAELAHANRLEFELLENDGVKVEHGTLRLWGHRECTEEEMSELSASELSYFALPHEDLLETNSQHPKLTQIRDTDNIYGVILCIDAVEGMEPRTVFWDRNLTMEEIHDEANKSEHGSYGYSTKLLEDSPVSAICLKPGDLGLIPAHKLHSVIGYQDALRCTLSGFVHFARDDDGNPTKMIFRT